MFWAATVVVVVVLIVAILTFAFQTPLVKFANDHNWGFLAGLLSGPWYNQVPTLILGIGTIAAVYQVAQTRRGTSSQVAVELFRHLRRPDTLWTLRALYEIGPEEAIRLVQPDRERATARGQKEEQMQKLRDELDDVIDNLELIGSLVSDGIIDRRMAVEAYAGSTALRCWYVLGGYVPIMRQERGSSYCTYFEDFAARAFEHFKNRRRAFGKPVMFRRGASGEHLDLVQYMLDNPTFRPHRRI